MPRALPMMLPALVSLVLVHCAGTPQPEVTPQEAITMST
jgi:predicted cobalt transporter CbtA